MVVYVYIMYKYCIDIGIIIDGTDCLMGHRCVVSLQSLIKLSECIVSEGLVKSG